MAPRQLLQARARKSASFVLDQAIGKQRPISSKTLGAPCKNATSSRQGAQDWAHLSLGQFPLFPALGQRFEVVAPVDLVREKALVGVVWISRKPRLDLFVNHL